MFENLADNENLKNIDDLEISSEVVDTKIESSVESIQEDLTVDMKTRLDEKMGEFGPDFFPQHQYKILEKGETKFIEIYLYGDMEYDTMKQVFAKTLALIEGCTDKDTLHLHVGSSAFCMDRSSAAAYLSAIKACRAHVITQSNNILNVYDLVLLLLGDEIKVSGNARCSFNDLKVFGGGSDIDKDACDYQGRMHKAQMKNVIIEKGFMTEEEWDNTIGMNHYFHAVGEDFSKRCVITSITGE